MSEYTEKAVELFKSGYNCSQSIVGAFAEYMGVDFNTAIKMAAGLGGGVGRMREVCGAICGASMIAGLKYGATVGSDAESKARTYEEVQRIVNEFKKTNSTIICRELIKEPEGLLSPTPDDRTPQYYKRRPCVKIVEDAAAAVEKVLINSED